MELTKLGHACVRLVHDGTTLVIDPGGFTEADAIDGADAVLVTHEHPDHFLETRLRAAVAADPKLEIWTNRAVASRLDGIGDRVHVVGRGDTFEVGGIGVEVHGELHEIIHPDIPRITNIGFLVAGRLFHPGDAFTVPGTPVATLMLPVHAPWSRIAQIIDYVREVNPSQAFAVHDGLLNPNGLGLIDGLLGDRGPGIGTGFRHLTPGDHIDLG